MEETSVRHESIRPRAFAFSAFFLGGAIAPAAWRYSLHGVPSVTALRMNTIYLYRHGLAQAS
jgi:hypothetical protein